MKPPVLWNRLESSASYLHSIIGENGLATTGTPVYAANKFGNGSQHYSTSAAGSIGFYRNFGTAFTIEFWYKALTASSDNTDFFPGFGNYVIYTIANPNNFDFVIYSAGVKIRYVFPLTFSIGDIFHLAIVCDSGGANKARLFKNGSEIAVATKVTDNTWTATNLYFYIANASGGAAKYNIDNFKIYDYAKTDFSDRNNERGGLNDSVTCI